MHHHQPKNLFFIATYVFTYVLTFSYVDVHGNYGEGFVGLFQQQKHHWTLSLFELWSMRLHISKTQLCAKERMGVYSVVRSVISLLINRSLDFDIQNKCTGGKEEYRLL